VFHYLGFISDIAISFRGQGHGMVMDSLQHGYDPNRIVAGASHVMIILSLIAELIRVCHQY
jgi:hypothetical protein